jgi:hypothetical protein
MKKESAMTDGNQVLREHALEWIAAGLVALFIFSGILFYSLSVDVRSINATHKVWTGTHIGSNDEPLLSMKRK